MWSGVQLPEGTREDNIAIAKTHIAEKRYVEALKILNPYHDLLPNNLEILKMRAAVFCSMGNQENFQKDLAQLKALQNPSSKSNKQNELINANVNQSSKNDKQNEFINAYVAQFYETFKKQFPSATGSDKETLKKELQAIAGMIFEAKKDMEEGRYENAVAKFSLVLLTWREDREMHYLAAKAGLLWGKPDAFTGAVIALEKLLKECDQLGKEDKNAASDMALLKFMAKCHYCLGRLYEARKEKPEAQKAFVTALFFDNNEFIEEKNDPKIAIDHDDRMAALNFFIKQLPEHKETQNEVEKIRQEKTAKNHIHFLKLGLVLLENKFYEDALTAISVAKWLNETFKESQTEGRKSPAFFHLLGRNILIDIGICDPAIFVQRLLVECENIIIENVHLGHKVLTEEERRHEFVKEICKSIKKFFRQQKYKEAIEFLQHAMILEPENEEVYLYLGKAYCLENNWDEAIAVYDKALSQWPQKNAFRTERDKAEQAKKQPKEVKAVLVENVAKQPKPSVKKPASQTKFSQPKPKKTPEELEASAKLRAEMAEKNKLEEQFKGTGTNLFKKLVAENIKQQDLKRQKEHASEAERKRNKKRRLRAKAKTTHEAQKHQEQMNAIEFKKAQEEATAKAQKKLEEEKSRREAAFNELKREEKRRHEFNKKLDERIKEAILAKEKIPFSDLGNYYLDEKRVDVKPFEHVLMDTLEENKSCVAIAFGGTARSRLAKLKDVDLNDPEKDLDIVTTATPDQILKSLAQYQPKETAKKGQFQIQTLDEKKNKIDIQITSTSCQKFKEFTEGLDFTINSAAFDKYGRLYDATGHAVEDLMAKRLRTVNESPAASFAEDSSRVLRGADFIRRFKLTADNELLTQMERCASLIPTKADSWRIHSWMMRAFSSRFVSPEQAIGNFTFLSEERITPKGEKWNLLSKLFTAEAAEFILRESSWVCSELRKGPVTQREIYMIFYVSLAMQIKPYETAKTQIYGTCHLLKDKLEGSKNFRWLYEKYLASWEQAHAKPTPVQQPQVNPSKSTMFIPGLSMFGGFRHVQPARAGVKVRVGVN